MNRIVAVVGCLVSMSAWAQNSYFYISPPMLAGQDKLFIGPAGCDQTLQLQWMYAVLVSGTPSGDLRIWATERTSCAETPTSGEPQFASVPWGSVSNFGTGAFSVPLPSLPMFDGGVCPEMSSTSPTLICASMPYVPSSNGSTAYAQGVTSVWFDRDPPATPVISSSAGLDRTIQVNFVSPTDASVVALEVSAPGDPAFYRLARVPSENRAVSANNLSNGVEYRARLVAIDGAGNESAPTESITVSPVELERTPLQNDPSQSCSTAPGFLFALVALWLRRVSSR